MRLNLRLDVTHEQKAIMVNLVAAQLSEVKLKEIRLTIQRGKSFIKELI